MSKHNQINWDRYEKVARQLVDRILDTVAKDPLLAMTDAWELFSISGFQCGDLGPSYAQASWALLEAQKITIETGE